MKIRKYYYIYHLRILAIFSFIVLTCFIWTTYAILPLFGSVVNYYIKTPYALLGLIEFTLLALCTFFGIKKWPYAPFLLILYVFKWLKYAKENLESLHHQPYFLQFSFMEQITYIEAISLIILSVLTVSGIILFIITFLNERHE